MITNKIYYGDCPKEGDLILDCFVGSCTTAVSAIYTKRNFICFELCRNRKQTNTRSTETNENARRHFTRKRKFILDKI
ncbi:MAG: site-specific DNA-methyltransferase [Firmicutes bacterium]|nr:site-specific DNA-methyltransferase [Bacillota bacterium]